MSTLNNQPLTNIGCLGSVSDGKSTLVEKLTGTKTQRHSSEKTRNITKNQGYANMKIWSDTNADGSIMYHTTDTHPTEFKNANGNTCPLVNHISFVDCPGHQELIKVMLSSTALMDGAILVVAVNDKPPSEKPQLIQHLAAIKLGHIKNIIVCLNKIDLVPKDLLLQRKQELDEMLEQYEIRPYAVIPTCFNKGIGTKYVIKAMMELFNPANFAERNSSLPIFRISRSFDINKPGTNWADINGGVIGGSLVSGKISTGDEIEIRPGMLIGKPGKMSCKPIKTTVLSIKTDTTELDEIYPGGLIGIGTEIDPLYSKTNYLAGNVAGLVGTLPNVYLEIAVSVEMITMFGYSWKPTVTDTVSIQIGTHMVDASVKSIKKYVCFSFATPVCIPDNQHIIICRTIDGILRIVGEGTVDYDNNPNFLPMV
jgi:translation initiation factor 2 subunit 3